MRIRYRLRAEKEKNTEFHTEPMKEMFEGVFAREFMLFYGEVLEYTLIRGEERDDLSVHSVSGSQIDTGDQTKYQRLNRMLGDWHVGNLEQLDIRMQAYVKTEYVCREMFTLL